MFWQASYCTAAAWNERSRAVAIDNVNATNAMLNQAAVAVADER
jgi:hypothetical protein